MNFREKRDRFLNLKTSRRALVSTLALLVVVGLLSGSFVLSWRFALALVAIAPACYLMWTAK